MAPFFVFAQTSVFDENQSDDDIVQLSNLRVQSVSGTIITASYDFGVKCRFYKDTAAPTGQELPCPLAPSALYQIQTDGARLLLRNRQRASLNDFEVGNRINVYGFMDRDNRAVEALIVRNLDKPQRQTFIQLNNVETYSEPSSPSPPSNFIVVNKYSFPCRDFTDGAGGGVSVPCPFRLEVQEAPQIAPGAGASNIPPPNPVRKYFIEVTSGTTILQRDRAPMALSGIGLGDRLNIYGSYTNDSQRIQAIIIRDLSRPVYNYGSLRVEAVSSTDCPYPTARSGASETSERFLPCGTIYNAAVYLYRSDGTFVTKTGTEQGFAFFDNLPAGDYSVTAAADGYEKNQAKAFVTSGQVNFVSVFLSKPQSGGSLYISPSNQTIGAGQKTEIQAFYQPPVLPCPAGAYCAQVMPASYPVAAKWVSSNPAVASVNYKVSVITQSYPSDDIYDTKIAVVSGVSAGSAEIKAVYTESSGNLLTATAKVSVGSSSNTLSITTTSLPNGSVNAGYIQTIYASGGTGSYTWSVSSGSLPPGLNLSPSYVCFASPCQAPAEIKGASTVAGTYTFTITVVSEEGSAAQSASRQFTINVSSTICPSLSPPLCSTGTTATPRYDANNCIVGYDCVPNTTQSSITVISPNYSWENATKGQTINIQWKSTSDISSIYIKLRKGSDTYYGPEGAVTSTTISNTGSYQWQVPTTLPDGSDYAIRVIDAAGRAQDDSDAPFSITSSASSLAITTTWFSSATIGVNYGATVIASGGAPSYNWNVISGTLPPGLIPATSACPQGVGPCRTSWYLAGTPTVAGAYTFTVSVTDGIQTASRQFTINVSSTIQGLPDLAVSSFDISPSTPYVGQKARITANVINKGSASAAVTPHSLSTNAPGQFYPTTISTCGLSLNAGGVCGIVTDIIFTGKGTFSVNLVLDGDNQVAESDETNNKSAINVSVVDPPSSQTSVRVISPNGGGQWVIGKTYNITWSTNAGVVNIELWKGTTFIQHIAIDVAGANGAYSWTVPSNLTSGNDYKIYVSVMSADRTYVQVYDTSDATFIITDTPYLGSASSSSQLANVLESIRRQLDEIAEKIRQFAR